MEWNECWQAAWLLWNLTTIILFYGVLKLKLNWKISAEKTFTLQYSLTLVSLGFGAFLLTLLTHFPISVSSLTLSISPTCTISQLNVFAHEQSMFISKTMVIHLPGNTLKLFNHWDFTLSGCMPVEMLHCYIVGNHTTSCKPKILELQTPMQSMFGSKLWWDVRSWRNSDWASVSRLLISKSALTALSIRASIT